MRQLLAFPHNWFAAELLYVGGVGFATAESRGRFDDAACTAYRIKLMSHGIDLLGTDADDQCRTEQR